MTIAMALGVGLLQGWLHCAGMCGPFVLAYALAAAPPAAGPGRPATARAPGRALLAAHLWHNLGRVAAFTVLGAVFGGLGSFVDDSAGLTGLQAPAAILGGAVMVLWALDQLRTGHGAAAVERWSPWRGLAQGGLRRLLGRRDPGGAFACGFLLGLHPCGLLFAVLLAAAATGSAAHGAAVLLAFGVGTVPAMLSVASAGTWGRAALRGRAYSYASAALIGAGGVLFALRGLAVNGIIPHVWPWLF